VYVNAADPPDEADQFATKLLYLTVVAADDVGAFGKVVKELSGV
jgi:hypothetical protein